MITIYVQHGENPLYPREIEVWDPNTDMNYPPSWFTDICKVRNIETYDGKIILDYLPITSGGYSFRMTDGSEIRVRADSVLGHGESKIVVLTKKKLNYLYNEKLNIHTNSFSDIFTSFNSIGRRFMSWLRSFMS